MHLIKITAALIGLAALSVLAQDAAGAASVATNTHPDLGVHLVDGDGFTLYMNSQDPKGESTCMDDCLVDWAPFSVEGEVGAGQGVAPTLLGSITRPDGSSQVTYFDVPLYRFAGDVEPGETNGLGLEERWYLVSPFGSAIVPASPPEPAEEATGADDPSHMELAMIMGTGQQVFADMCAACHGTRGQGGSGPVLAGGRVDDNRRVIRQVIFGGGHMPPFGGALDDDQIASVLTFVRKSWGNDFSVIHPEEVSTYRP